MKKEVEIEYYYWTGSKEVMRSVIVKKKKPSAFTYKKKNIYIYIYI